MDLVEVANNLLRYADDECSKLDYDEVVMVRLFVMERLKCAIKLDIEQTMSAHRKVTTVDETSVYDGTVHEMECSECGHTYEHVNGDYEFCPRCGRRIQE